MISREFIYEFSNFDDISARENDKKSCAHDISASPEAFSACFDWQASKLYAAYILVCA